MSKNNNQNPKPVNPKPTEPEPKQETNKKTKLKICTKYWGTYGVFVPNDVVELPAEAAKTFIKNKIAIEIKD